MTKQEGLTIFSSPDTEISSLKQNNSVKIQNTSVKHYNLPLKEYCIKASYNTAVTGKYVNVNMIKYVISRGCRLLDFEVYMIDKKPVVGFSTDPLNLTLDSEGTILLERALNEVVSNAFTTLGCPNSTDPLFVNLRINSNDPSVYKEVAKVVSVTIKSKLYLQSAVRKETKLSELMGKIVLMLDRTIIDLNDFIKFATCGKNEKNCIDLRDSIRMLTGGDELYIVNESEIVNQYPVPIHIMDDNINTNISVMRFINPDYDTTSEDNPNIFELIKNFGAQIVPYSFYHPDQNLTDYESFFDDNKTAFVPLSNAIRYIEKNRKT